MDWPILAIAALIALSLLDYAQSRRVTRPRPIAWIPAPVSQVELHLQTFELEDLERQAALLPPTFASACPPLPPFGSTFAGFAVGYEAQRSMNGLLSAGQEQARHKHLSLSQYQMNLSYAELEAQWRRHYNMEPLGMDERTLRQALGMQTPLIERARAVTAATEHV